MKKLLITVITLFVCSVSFSQALHMNVAKQYAKQWLTSVGQKSLADLDCVYTQSNEEKTLNYFYVFSSMASNSFVVVSADERILPVLGYSEESFFDPNNIPLNMESWLNGYVDEMNYVFSLNEIEKHPLWFDMEEGNIAKGTSAVEPLLGMMRWNQNSPYNYYCPVAAGGPGGKCYAGCVATAMSMIMKFWNFPPHGFGQSGYYSSYGYLSADYQNENYLWDDMPLKATSNNYDAIAKLMYHCGVSVEMGYGPGGSGAVTAYVADALTTYFGYKHQCDIEWKDDYPTIYWEDMMKEELNLGRPMQYRGGGSAGGHSFVLDGYDNNNLFHFNWGWGGTHNGYFTLSNLNPGTYTFNDDQYAVMYIEPNYALFGFVPVANISAIPTEATATYPLTLSGTVAPNNATNKTIKWTVESAGATGATIQPCSNILNTTSAGTCTVLATIENGASTTDNYTQLCTIIVSKATQSAPEPPTLENSSGTSITLHSISGYEYNINGGEWQTSSVFENLTKNTTYSFTQRKAETETYYASPESIEALFSTTLGIDENLLKSITIHPNPFAGEFRVTSSKLQITNIELYDVFGRKINSRFEIQNSEFVTDISHLSAGVYFVKVSTEIGEVIKKVVKE